MHLLDSGYHFLLRSTRETAAHKETRTLYHRDDNCLGVLHQRNERIDRQVRVEEMQFRDVSLQFAGYMGMPRRITHLLRPKPPSASDNLPPNTVCHS